MVTLSIPADFSLRTIRPLFDELVSAFRADAEVEIDCSTLVAIDISGIQLLISVARTAQAAGKRTRLRGASDVLDAALVRAGI